MDVKILQAGYCTHPEWTVIKGGKLRNRCFPANVGLLKHPNHGYLLFDTGYTEKFFSATEKWPYQIYRWITPVRIGPEYTVKHQLLKMGISPREINMIILSHLHADHIGGLCDFPKAKVVFKRDILKRIGKLKGIKALRQGFLPDLLPADIASRLVDSNSLEIIKTGITGFEKGRDLLGDGSILLIDLPGHAVGHQGVWVETGKGPRFFIADAAWLHRSYQQMIPPGSLSYLLFSNKKNYLAQLKKLHELHQKRKNLKIILSHDIDVQ